MNITAAQFSLQTLAKQGTPQEFQSALQQEGCQILDQAILTFCNPTRETEQGEQAVAKLRELTGSIRTYLERQQASIEQNLQELKSSIAQTTGLQARHEENSPDGKTKVVHSQEGLGLRVMGGPVAVEDLSITREKGQHYILSHRPANSVVGKDTRFVPDHSLEGMKRFLTDWSQVQGLYTAAVLIPGPLALSVKNFAAEQMTATNHSQSSYLEGSSSRKFFGLSRSSSAASGQSSQDSQVEYTKTTVDREVVPVLNDLQARLEQVKVVPQVELGVEASHYQETFESRGWGPFKAWSSKGSENTSRQLGRQVLVPELVRLPETSTSDFTPRPS